MNGRNRRCLPCVTQQSSSSGGYGQGAASSETQTMTMTMEEAEVSSNRIRHPQLVLRLKAEPAEKKAPAVQWSDDTVDNENLGRKTSKRK